MSNVTMNTNWAKSAIQPCPALILCHRCGEMKPPFDFSRNRGARGNRIDILGQGRGSECKVCQNNSYITLDPRRKMLYAARNRAKKSGLECTLTLEDIVIPELCPVLGIPLFASAGGGKRPPTMLENSPSLDRINNDKGYTPDNIRVISMRANNLKSDATLEELEAVVAYMKGCSSPGQPAALPRTTAV